MPELTTINRLGILLLAAALIVAVGGLVQYLQSRKDTDDPSSTPRRHTAIRMSVVAIILASAGLVLIVT